MVCVGIEVNDKRTGLDVQSFAETVRPAAEAMRDRGIDTCVSIQFEHAMKSRDLRAWIDAVEECDWLTHHGFSSYPKIFSGISFVPLEFYVPLATMKPIVFTECGMPTAQGRASLRNATVVLPNFEMGLMYNLFAPDDSVPEKVWPRPFRDHGAIPWDVLMEQGNG